MTNEEIVRTYSDMIYRIALGYVKNKYDADDIYSEVFLKYFKKTRHFNDEEHRKAWLIRVSVNAAKDHFTRHPVEKDLSEVESCLFSFDKPDYTDLYKAISGLHPQMQTIIYLFYFEDYKTREIAKTLNMNENTIKTMLKRAREKLKDYLD